MSQPRCIRPGQTWMITRRTTRRHYLLRPDRDGKTQALYWYTTAVLARKFGIRLHAVQMMSTHVHEVLTDVRGNLPAFLRERNRAFANALKCHRGWPEEVFQRAAANYVEIHGEAAVLRQIAYTLSNCVEAGLVRSPEDWPGVGVSARDIGVRVVRVTRPAVYFDPENPVWPQEAEISIEMPDLLLQHRGLEKAMALICRVVETATRKASEAARLAGRVVSTIADIVRVAFTKRSRSFERFGVREPTLAAGGETHRAGQARAARREFLQAYRNARNALRHGEYGIAFPLGTWRWTKELLPRLVCSATSSMSVGSMDLLGAPTLSPSRHLR